jgi:hypothetical protein
MDTSALPPIVEASCHFSEIDKLHAIIVGDSGQRSWYR